MSSLSNVSSRENSMTWILYHPTSPTLFHTGHPHMLDFLIVVLTITNARTIRTKEALVPSQRDAIVSSNRLPLASVRHPSLPSAVYNSTPRSRTFPSTRSLSKPLLPRLHLPAPLMEFRLVTRLFLSSPMPRTSLCRSLLRSRRARPSSLPLSTTSLDNCVVLSSFVWFFSFLSFSVLKDQLHALFTCSEGRM